MSIYCYFMSIYGYFMSIYGYFILDDTTFSQKDFLITAACESLSKNV